MIPLWDALLNLGTAAVALTTKSLPSDEERRARLKLHTPKIYARVKRHILREAFMWQKRHKGTDMDAYVDFIATDDEDRMVLKKLLHSVPLR